MKCKTVNKKLILYFNNELSVAENNAVKSHLENCSSCYNLYSELETSYNLIGKKEELTPNPFLYTRIKERLINRENQTTFIPVYKKVLQATLFSLLLIIGIAGGIKLGSISVNHQEKKLLSAKTTEFYFNDLGQENIEAFLLKN